MEFYELISSSFFKVFIACCILVGGQFAVKKFLMRLEKKCIISLWINMVFVPLIAVFWMAAVLCFLNTSNFCLKFSTKIAFLNVILQIGIVVCFVVVFFRWKKEFISKCLKRALKKQDFRKIKIIDRLSVVVIVLFALFFLLQCIKAKVAPFLLTFGGVGAAALGFAGKDIIANFVGGIILQFTCPFLEGDFIILPEKQVEGVVEDIGFFYIRLRDKEQRQVDAPNGMFISSIITNSSMITHRVIKQKINISFENTDKISLVTDKIHQTLLGIKQISHRLPSQVVLKKFNDFSCEVDIEAYATIINLVEFQQLQQMILLKVTEDLKSLGVSIALPFGVFRTTV